MIQARIDRMHPTDQVVIKTAAVLGKQFPLEMLYSTVPQNVSHTKIDSSLVRLIKSRIIECEALVAPSRPSSEKSKNAETTQQENNPGAVGGSTPTPPPPPPATPVLASPADKFKMVRFVTSDFQEIAYDMFLENVRIPLHIKAAQFLEHLVHKCNMCGGGNFLDRSPAEIDHRTQSLTMTLPGRTVPTVVEPADDDDDDAWTRKSRAKTPTDDTMSRHTKSGKTKSRRGATNTSNSKCRACHSC